MRLGKIRQEGTVLGQSYIIGLHIFHRLNAIHSSFTNQMLLRIQSHAGEISVDFFSLISKSPKNR